MARNETVITVFVASPGDVSDERERLEQVITELNVTWSKQLGLRLELVQWESHAFPGFGEDAQDVINNEIPADYDIFIGIMWSRFGTPTQRAGSGTEEEFKRAKEKLDADRESVKLMMYFKIASIPLREIDPDQVAKVEAFRKSLGEQGGLWWDFSDVDEFEKHVRIHLSCQVQNWKPKSDSVKALPIQTDAGAPALNEAESNDQEDLGLFDLMEIFEARTSEFVAIAQRITDATKEIGEKMEERTHEIYAVPRDSTGKPIRTKAKKIITKTAADMDHYAHRLESELPLFSRALNEGMDKLIAAVELSAEYDMAEDRKEIEAGLEQAATLRATISSSSGMIRNFRNVVAKIPPLTQEINRSKRRIVLALDKLLSEMGKGESLVHEAELAFAKFLDGGTSK